MANLLIGILFVAAVATAGDYVWFEIGVRHRAIAGAIHGAVLLGAVGLVLALQFGAWLVAWAPGMLAIAAGKRSDTA